MSLASMDDGQVSRPPGLKQASIRLDGAPELGDIVAKHFSESARLEKVSLHVDNEQSAMREVDLIGVGLGLNAQDGAIDHCGRVDCTSRSFCKRLVCQIYVAEREIRLPNLDDPVIPEKSRHCGNPR
jgi:hypothetical protein